MSSLTENIIRRPPTTANLTVAVVTGVTLATIFSKAVSKTLDATWNALDETMLEYQPRASLARYAQKLGDIERTICELEFSLGVQRLATDTRPPCSSAAKSEEVQTVYELKLRLVNTRSHLRVLDEDLKNAGYSLNSFARHNSSVWQKVNTLVKEILALDEHTTTSQSSHSKLFCKLNTASEKDRNASLQNMRQSNASKCTVSEMSDTISEEAWSSDSESDNQTLAF